MFKRNGTLETRLALKAKQNRFHHKVAKNKKVYISYTEGSKRCNLCLQEKLSILKEKKLLFDFFLFFFIILTNDN